MNKTKSGLKTKLHVLYVFSDAFVTDMSQPLYLDVSISLLWRQFRGYSGSKEDRGITSLNSVKGCQRHRVCFSGRRRSSDVYFDTKREKSAF